MQWKCLKTGIYIYTRYIAHNLSISLTYCLKLNNSCRPTSVVISTVAHYTLEIMIELQTRSLKNHNTFRILELATNQLLSQELYKKHHVGSRLIKHTQEFFYKTNYSSQRVTLIPRIITWDRSVMNGWNRIFCRNFLMSQSVACKNVLLLHEHPARGILTIIRKRKVTYFWVFLLRNKSVSPVSTSLRTLTGQNMMTTVAPPFRSAVIWWTRNLLPNYCSLSVTSVKWNIKFSIKILPRSYE